MSERKACELATRGEMRTAVYEILRAIEEEPLRKDAVLDAVKDHYSPGRRIIKISEAKADGVAVEENGRIHISPQGQRDFRTEREKVARRNKLSGVLSSVVDPIGRYSWSRQHEAIRRSSSAGSIRIIMHRAHRSISRIRHGQLRAGRRSAKTHQAY